VSTTCFRPAGTFCCFHALAAGADGLAPAGAGSAPLSTARPVSNATVTGPRARRGSAISPSTFSLRCFLGEKKLCHLFTLARYEHAEAEAISAKIRSMAAAAAKG
jgi:hypothetical protein